MPRFRIHRQRDHVRQHFRSAPHVAGVASVKARDYRLDAGSIEARTPYGAYFALKEAGNALDVGDLLESEGGELTIYKYVGFEPARWAVAEMEAVSAQVEGPAPPAVGE